MTVLPYMVMPFFLFFFLSLGLQSLPYALCFSDFFVLKVYNPPLSLSRLSR